MYFILVLQYFRRIQFFIFEVLNPKLFNYTLKNVQVLRKTVFDFIQFIPMSSILLVTEGSDIIHWKEMNTTSVLSIDLINCYILKR